MVFSYSIVFSDVSPLYSNLTELLLRREGAEELSVKKAIGLLPANDLLRTKVNQTLLKGELIPSDFVNAIIKQRVGNKPGNYLFTDYPSTADQFNLLNSFMEGEGYTLSNVYHVKIVDIDGLIDRHFSQLNDDQRERVVQNIKNRQLQIERLSGIKAAAWKTIYKPVNGFTDQETPRQALGD